MMTDRYASSVDGLWSDLERYRSWHTAWMWSASASGDEELAKALAVTELTPSDLDGIARFEQTYSHDLVACCEYVRSRLPSDVRQRLHANLTSSDIVDTGLAITMRRTWGRLSNQIKILRAQTARQADTHAYTPVVGRTHGREAAVTSLGRRWATLAAQVDRARLDLFDSSNRVGVGHLSGPTGDRPIGSWPPEFNIVRDHFPTQITCRDRHAAWVQSLARVATACEQIAVEIRLGAQSGVDLYTESSKPGARGSSAMPHKRNPVRSERICGLARVVRADAAAMAESVVSWFERDISHSSVERTALRRAACLTSYLVAETGMVVYTLEVDSMRAAVAADNFGIGSDVAVSRLVESGTPHRLAYDMVATLGARTALEGAGLDVTPHRYDPGTEPELWHAVAQWSKPGPPEAEETYDGPND